MRNHLSRDSARFVKLLCITLLMSACGGGGGTTTEPPPPPPPPPPPGAQTASLQGIITDEGDGSRVAGAVVTIGSASVTTGADGTFAFASLSSGVVTIRIAAQGFNPLETGASLVAGSNTRTFVIMRDNVLFESSGWATYIPHAVTAVRGVFVIFYGGSLDARPMIRGDVNFYSTVQLWPDAVQKTAEHRRRLLLFARAHGFAIVGTQTPVSPHSLYSDLRSVLNEVGARTGRGELPSAPLLIMGHSRGGCMAYQLAVQAGDDVIGVLPLASSGATPCLDGAPDPTVPVYMIVAQFDLDGVLEASLQRFVEHRSRGELWGLAVEAGRPHAWPVSDDVLFHWAEAVTSRRLPPTSTPGAPIQLRSIAESTGWLADQTSFAIGAFNCFTGDRKAASWLPAEQNAREWQSIAAPAMQPVVLSCSR